MAWKRVENTYYEVNEKGELRNMKTRKCRTQSYDKNGYVQISAWLISLKRYRGLKLHREVAKAFIPNPDNKPCINHIDGDNKNNSVLNLEWMTHNENMKHNYNVLGRGLKPVEQLMGDETISIFKSAVQAENITGVKRSSICDVAKGRQKTAGGFVWKYV